ncbi:WGxxGxxG family protein [Paenibacillus naphthalenovorans]|uniref:WGxxGxxG family protein n=1 Tax=Paenibacillus naphthalenovorans TaxID=162209 RepID=UPI00088F63D5|nr:WGxxGxxG family protein [Paenibacillus naphthalenovorans]GCL72299.1 hypothetical protein PN4B1_22040 [Paenibacillus naphthalenovorans]SDJ21422.1 hypothetical protein SAMN05421868_12076 [Paenibacillus naphthalenovorans]
MNKLGKTVLALALTASLGFGGQAFAEVSSTGTGLSSTQGTSTATAPGSTTTTGTGTATYTGTTGTAGTAGRGTATYNDPVTGTRTNNYNDNMLDRMNTYNTRTGYGYGGNYDTTTYRTNAATAGRGMDWGWLGLLGLLGLAGLRGRNHEEGREK